ncbi:MAG TPA: MATE family efflux transporter [Candidatus Brocadiia bacterium]|nr:MATE family efflux transporter [Candidatus Brocadiia bacterium]
MSAFDKIGRLFMPGAKDLTDGPVVAAIIALAVPNMIGGLLFQALSLTDMWFVGRLGTAAIAAVGVSRPVIFFLVTFFAGVGVATTAIISRAVGEGNMRKAGHGATQALILSMLASVAVTIAGMLLAPGIVLRMGAKPEVYPLAVSYMRITFLGFCTMFGMWVIGAILRAAGDSMTPLLLMLASVLINVVLDPIMIFGLLGFPKMGVAGSALATLISQAISCAIGLSLLRRGSLSVRIGIDGYKPDFPVMWRFFAIGMPSSLQMMLRSAMDIVMMSIVAGFGTAVIAGYSVGLNVRMIALTMGFGISGACATMVGQCLGAGKPDRAEKSAIKSSLLACGFMSAIALASILFAPWIIRIFDPSESVVEAGRSFLRISSYGLVTASFGIVLSNALNGAGDTVSPMVITFIGLWVVQVPLAVLLSRAPSLQEKGIWYAWVIASLVQSVMVGYWFSLGRWKARKV